MTIEPDKMTTRIVEAMKRLDGLSPNEIGLRALEREVDKLINEFGARDLVIFAFMALGAHMDGVARARHSFDEDGEQP